MIKSITNKIEWKSALKNMKHDWYHTWDYHKVAFDNDEGVPTLLYVELPNINLAIPLLIRKIDENWNDATSVYGYPGIIFNKPPSEYEFNCFFEELNNWAKVNNIVSIFSRLNSCIEVNIDEQVPSIENKGETVVIDLRISLDEQRSKYRKNYRNLINKLNKEGYTCTWSNTDKDKIDFIEIYNETMKSLGAQEYYFFSQNYYDELFTAEDFDVKIYNCHLDGVKVCSGLFVYCDDIVQYHLSGTVSEYKKIAPTRLMIDTVRKDATKLGYKVFHLGGGTTGTRDSLFDFKFGFSKSAINFKVLKLITNREKYAELSNIDVLQIDSKQDAFFPLYRKR